LSFGSLPEISAVQKQMLLLAALGSAEQVERIFGKDKVYGPVFRWMVKVYGRDIIYPLKPELMSTIVKLVALVQEEYAAAPVLEAGYFSPPAAPIESHNAGKPNIGPPT
jgi:hypothetical protein